MYFETMQVLNSLSHVQCTYLLVSVETRGFLFYSRSYIICPQISQWKPFKSGFWVLLPCAHDSLGTSLL